MEQRELLRAQRDRRQTVDRAIRSHGSDLPWRRWAQSQPGVQTRRV